MKLSTWLTSTLGIQYPVIQGAFHRFGTSALAGPVSAAGGLGIITAHNFEDAKALREDIRRAKDMTDNPIGVNFSVLPDDRSKLPPSKLIPKGAMNCEGYLSRLEAVLEEGVKVVFTAGYDGSGIGRRAQQAGAVWMHKAVTIKHAVSTAGKGVDALVITGLESSGFKNAQQNTTLINITALRRMISTPLIAAGGIGDGYGLAGALAMGACGVYMGTAFMATQECPISAKWKQLILDHDITEPEYHQKILGLGSHGLLIPSMASAVINQTSTVDEFMGSLMQEANQAMERLQQMRG